MAYNIVQIPVVDLKPSTALGVKLPFSYPSAFTSVYTTLEQTKYNILNFMLTNPNERPFNPNFGAGLRAMLFEQVDQEDLDSLKETLIVKINNYFPNVQVTNLSILGSPDTNSISIILTYTLKNIKSSDSLTIKIQQNS